MTGLNKIMNLESYYKMKPFTRYIQQLFENCNAKLPFADNPQIQKVRSEASKVFFQKELPSKKLENWRHQPIDELVEDQYDIQLQPNPYRPVDEIFKCKVHNIDTNMFTFLNGWYIHKNNPLTIFPEGIIVGSLNAAIERFPELVFPYLAKQDLEQSDSMIAFNEMFFNDGIFIYIPDNIIVSKPMQIIYLVDSDQNLMIHNRNLIIVGKNSSLSLVHCDDSLNFKKTLINNVTEVYLSEHATFNHYKMENKDADSLLVNHLFIEQKTSSKFFSNVITFNAGYVRNMIKVDLIEPFADAKLYGLYLVDKKQYVDNQIYVNHSATDCTSYQLYKGIADDEAAANFNGHILVKKDSQRTVAFQTNRNIALTDNAKITTKPFLEIYADDVQCSHGATIGQLDENAMFYLRSRGICERSARMLLMYAFANEVVNFIEITSLQERYTDMVKKRLSGELTVCDQCVLHCSDEKDFSFEIDISKI